MAQTNQFAITVELDRNFILAPLRIVQIRIESIDETDNELKKWNRSFLHER